MNTDITDRSNPLELESLDDYVVFLEKIISSPLIDISFDKINKKVNYTIGYAKVDQINELTLIIHPDKDPPPHFHIESADFAAKLAISDCSVIIGSIQTRDLKLVRYWHANGGKEKLIEKWNSTRPYNCTVGKYIE